MSGLSLKPLDVVLTAFLPAADTWESVITSLVITKQ